MVREKRASSEMPVAFGAGIADMGESERGAGHVGATRLVADVRFVTFTQFVARFTNVTSSRGSSNVNDHVIMSFDIIVQ